MSAVPNILIVVPGKKEKLPLSVTHPELAKEADGWDSSEIFAEDSSRLQWKCEFGHLWSAQPRSRKNNLSGCPVCLNRQLLVGFNDLQTHYPEIASESHGWSPLSVLAGSSEYREWKCKFSHVWKARISHRTKSQSNCPVCANKKILSGFNDIATTHPEIAREAVGWDPMTVSAGNDALRLWRCEKGHQYRSSCDNRIGKGKGCPYCSNVKVLAGFNDLETTHPDIAKEAYGWDPQSIVAGSSRKVNWLCPSGHIFISAVFSRTSNNSSCTFCTNRKVLAGFNDLATTHPDIAKEAYGWDPSCFLFGSTQIKTWKCREGHTWKVRIAHRTVDGSNCPGCSVKGFNPSKDGFLYLIQHNDWEMVQIGITNTPDDRLTDHKRRGWEVLEIRGPMDGHLTQQWETAILRMLKAKGADLSNEKIAGKFDGYSEAWSKSTFEVKSIKELMRLTEEFEG